jgi:hypothetical protein
MLLLLQAAALSLLALGVPAANDCEAALRLTCTAGAGHQPQNRCPVCTGIDGHGAPVVPPASCTVQLISAFCTAVPPPEPAPPPPPPALQPAAPISTSGEEVAIMRRNFQTVAAANLNNPSHTTCSTDMRDGFPACHQLGTMWCWATAVASAAEYYTDHSESQCIGLECDIVGWTFSKQCCPFETTGCGDRGASWATVQKALDHFTGKSWQRPQGPLDKGTLDATLQSGNPIVMMVGPDTGPQHVVTVHGCDGSGKYWFHDSEFISDPTVPDSKYYVKYFQVDYSWLLEMCYVWVKAEDETGPKLVACTRGSQHASNEIFRIEHRWWDTLYIPAPPAGSRARADNSDTEVGVTIT